jgi:hypothetical protein
VGPPLTFSLSVILRNLLGGQHGPLRLLTRAVIYSVVFSIGYGVGLGLFFGLASGIATGLTLSIELNRAARGLDHYCLPWEAVFFDPWIRFRSGTVQDSGL